jgi:hypothetical protein
MAKYGGINIGNYILLYSKKTSIIEYIIIMISLMDYLKKMVG